MDLRSFIDRLAEAGKLYRVERSVDTKKELGEIARSHCGPILFEKIAGYPGARVFTNGLSDPQCIALALDLPATTAQSETLAGIRERLAHPVKPTQATTAAWKEHRLVHSDIDFLRLPVPQWHPQDVAPYLGTWHINVTHDPDTGVRNVGVYRMQLLGTRTATVSTSPKSHLGMQLAKAEKQARPLEMAVAIGVAEPVVMAASAACPYGADEYELAGALSQKSVRLSRCETVSVDVPADAEIVIEGMIKPGVRVTDGPYFDYAGVPNTNSSAFLFEATALNFTSNPVFRGTSVGRPGAEDHQLFAVLADANLLDFHGKRAKQALQNALLRRRLFKPFQFIGRIGARLRGDFV